MTAMSYEDLFPLDCDKEVLEMCPVSPPNGIIERNDFYEEITDVFVGLDFDCPSELNSPSDTDSRQSDSWEKPVRKRLIIGKHIKINEDRLQKFTCTLCNCNFSRKQQIRYHDYCVTGKRPLKCDLCGKGFIKKSHLMYHVRTHTGESPFKCDICQKGFKQKAKLKRHEKIHSRNADSRLVCSKCTKSFSDKDSLKKHEQKHNLTDTYPCSYCKKSYADKFTLKQHMEIHKNPSFICDVCGKTFVRKNSLNVHKQIHDDVYPFECDNCHKTFRSNKELLQHSVVHKKGNAGFECNTCSTTFGRKDNLLRHIRNCHLDPCQKKSLQDAKTLCTTKDKTKTKENNIQEANETDSNKNISRIEGNDRVSQNKCLKQIKNTAESMKDRTNTADYLNNSYDNTDSRLVMKPLQPKDRKKERKLPKKSKVKINNQNKNNSKIERKLHLKKAIFLNNKSPPFRAELKLKRTPKSIEGNSQTVVKDTAECIYNLSSNSGEIKDSILNGPLVEFNIKHSSCKLIAAPFAEVDKEKSIDQSKRGCVLVSALKVPPTLENSLEDKDMPSNNVFGTNFGKSSDVENLMSNKSHLDLNLVPQKASVIVHTDEFKTLVREANATREPVIKCLRSSMLSEEVDKSILELREPP